MSPREKYCYRIMKTYNIVVDFQGEVEKKKVPGYVKNETFAEWKARVLGAGVSNVVVYLPNRIAPGLKVEDFAADPGPITLRRVFRKLTRRKRGKSLSSSAGKRKEDYRYQVLLEHNLLVDFDGPAPRHSVARERHNEKIVHWKKRVLGKRTTNVVIYTPIEPIGEADMDSLMEVAGALHYARYSPEVPWEHRRDIVASTRKCLSLNKNANEFVETLLVAYSKTSEKLKQL